MTPQRLIAALALTSLLLPEAVFAFTECRSDADCGGKQCQPAGEVVCAGYRPRVATECAKRNGAAGCSSAFALDGISFQGDTCMVSGEQCAVNEPRFSAYCKDYFEGDDRYKNKKFCAEGAGAGTPSAPSAPAPALRFTPTPPKLQLPIPGQPFEFSKVALQGPENERFLLIPWLAQYLAALYRYGLSIVGVIAIVMIVVGGMRWLLAAGNSGQIEKAKDAIRNAVIGLLIALTTSTILYIINPEILRFRAIRISFVPPIPYYESEETDAPLAPDTAENSAPEIYCPKSGGRDAIPRIVQSLTGKIVYRFGGKGQRQPPFYENKPQLLYLNSQSCPGGTVCLDCSGFVDYVYRCAGLPVSRGGTGAIFSSPSTAKITERDWDHNRINGRTLRPGDLIGWLAGSIERPTRAQPAVGHVLIYIGDGKVAESTGAGRGVPGFNAVQNPRISQLSQLSRTWPAHYFTRVVFLPD